MYIQDMSRQFTHQGQVAKEVKLVSGDYTQYNGCFIERDAYMDETSDDASTASKINAKLIQAGLKEADEEELSCYTKKEAKNYAQVNLRTLEARVIESITCTGSSESDVQRLFFIKHLFAMQPVENTIFENHYTHIYPCVFTLKEGISAYTASLHQENERNRICTLEIIRDYAKNTICKLSDIIGNKICSKIVGTSISTIHGQMILKNELRESKLKHDDKALTKLFDSQLSCEGMKSLLSPNSSIDEYTALKMLDYTFGTMFFLLDLDSSTQEQLREHGYINTRTYDLSQHIPNSEIIPQQAKITFYNNYSNQRNRVQSKLAPVLYQYCSHRKVSRKSKGSFDWKSTMIEVTETLPTTEKVKQHYDKRSHIYLNEDK